MYYSKEERRAYRIKERLPVSWSLKDKGLNGKAIVRNLSATGMLLNVRSDAAFSPGSVLSFAEEGGKGGGFLPVQGRLVWARKKAFMQNSADWGVEFLEPAQEAVRNIQERVQSRIEALNGRKKFLNVIGIFCVVILIVLAEQMIMQQFAIQNNMRESLRIMMTTSQNQASLYRDLVQQNKIKDSVIAEVYNELDATKVLLSRTESKLDEMTGFYQASQSEIGSLKQEMADAPALERALANLKEENGRLKNTMDELKEQLLLYEGEIASLDAGRTSLGVHRQRIHMIKRAMRDLRRQAHLARIKAQKEMDRIRLAQGNKGYLIKDFKVVQPSAVDPQPTPKTRVRVLFFE